MADAPSTGWKSKTRVPPNQSLLWDHLELIRTMRLGRKTWEEIAEAIEKASGKRVAFTTVYNFYKRVAERAKKGKPFPLGYEDPFAGITAKPSPASPTSAPPSPEPDAQAAAREALRAKAKQLSQQPNKPAWDLHVDDDKPLKG